MEDENHEFQSRHLFKIGCSIFMDSMDFKLQNLLDLVFRVILYLLSVGITKCWSFIDNFYCRKSPVHRKRYLKPISEVQSNTFQAAQDGGKPLNDVIVLRDRSVAERTQQEDVGVRLGNRRIDNSAVKFWCLQPNDLHTYVYINIYVYVFISYYCMLWLWSVQAYTKMYVTRYYIQYHTKDFPYLCHRVTF